MRNRTTRRIGALLAVSATLALTVGSGTPASATSATATITGGSLAFLSAPPAVSLSATLNGSDQTVTTGQALDVGDNTGSGAGWNLSATSTTFTSGSNTLSNSATTVGSAPSVACDANVTCTTANNNISYPYSLPAGNTAPTATKLFNAAANTGMGGQTVTPTWRLAVPANTFAGTYSSVWTLSLASGP